MAFNTDNLPSLRAPTAHLIKKQMLEQMKYPNKQEVSLEEYTALDGRMENTRHRLEQDS